MFIRRGIRKNVPLREPFVQEFHYLKPILTAEVVFSGADMVADNSFMEFIAGLCEPSVMHKHIPEARPFCDFTCGNTRKKFRFRVRPQILFGTSHIDAMGKVHGNQLMLVKGKLMLTTYVFCKSRAKPIRENFLYFLDVLADFVSVKCGARTS